MEQKKLKIAISSDYLKREYRPCCVAIITDANNRVLFVNSEKNLDDWGLPQGGIEENEDIIDALFREIEEEVAIPNSLLVLQAYLGKDKLNAPKNRQDKRGFRYGKHYYFFALRYSGRAELCINYNELENYQWVASAKEALELMVNTRSERRQMILNFVFRTS